MYTCLNIVYHQYNNSLLWPTYRMFICPGDIVYYRPYKLNNNTTV